MRKILKTLGTVLLLTGLLGQIAYGQTARKFAKKAVTVRLCPSKCVKVTGHGYQPGTSAQVFETRGGWARVSGYLDRAGLVPSFGDKITKKPALWVPLSSFVSTKKVASKKLTKKKKAASKKPAKKIVKKKINKKQRVARLRRIPLPKFRPNTVFAAGAVAEPIAVEQPVIAETVTVAEPVMKVEEPVVEIIQSAPITSTRQAKGSKAPLTWEQVQAKIAAQKSGGQSAVAKKAADAAKVAAAKKAADAAKVAAAKKAADAAKVAAAKKTADAAKVAAAKKAADAVKLAAAKKTADAAKVAAAKKTVDAAKVASAKKTADAVKLAAAKKTADAAKVAAAKKAADTVKVAAAKKAADAVKVAAAKKTADAKRIADITERNRQARLAAEKAEAAKQAKLPTVPKAPAKDNASVDYQPPKEQPDAKSDDTKVAIVLPPKKVEVPKEEVEEPISKAVKVDPISLGARPKKLTKALRDKRLRRLPGRKSKVRKDVVIALRHYALGLLKSGECTGIKKGGPSAVPGMLYVICTDDPTYLRQFPLKEESW